MWGADQHLHEPDFDEKVNQNAEKHDGLKSYGVNCFIKDVELAELHALHFAADDSAAGAGKLDDILNKCQCLERVGVHDKSVTITQ